MFQQVSAINYQKAVECQETNIYFLFFALSAEMMPVPRTSLDLELDLQAQHTKLETLNAEIEKLKNLKQRLEQAVDKKDNKIAAWAIENEDFQRLVENVDGGHTAEDKKLKKLLHKTSKEIYKLRKTRLPKGQPDIVTFKYVTYHRQLLNAFLDFKLIFFSFLFSFRTEKRWHSSLEKVC